jgi:hypothetical protein
MIAKRSDHGWRATGLAVALFAITLNFLQPLAHAAMMRDGAPSTLWTAFCNSAAADPDGSGAGKSGQAPMTASAHECCLGLAHVPAITTPPVSFVALAPVSTFIAPLVAVEQSKPVGIRDGPTRPRGPPSFA